MYHRGVYTSLPPGKTQCACTTVKKLSRVLGRVYDSKLSPVGLNITQQAVLRCISRRAGEPLVRIAEELEMDRTSLYRALTPMIRDGWVASMSAKGSRFRTARLTKAGRRVLDSANQKWANVQGTLISRFGQASYDSLLAELYRLADCAADVGEDAVKINVDAATKKGRQSSTSTKKIKRSIQIDT
jgi:DNA-binding MarR family transcriptional regulator